MKPKPNIKKQADKTNPEATAKIKDQVQDSVRGLHQFHNTLFDAHPRHVRVQHTEYNWLDSGIVPLIMAGSFSLGLAVHAMIGR